MKVPAAAAQPPKATFVVRLPARPVAQPHRSPGTGLIDTYPGGNAPFRAHTVTVRREAGEEQMAQSTAMKE
jgi:hypothetical protein